ncbi:DUF2199 domain-containing protein [Microbacterium sp.]|uniref:DUF2199 domain-containing protein n=1 Tax=Microbacterium TaxID=33882 RepID=UPI00324221C9
MTNAEKCELCGKPVDLHDRQVRLVYPDPVLDAGEIPASDIWMTHSDANTSVMMQVNHIGAFVRALLPVHLTAGHTITYGVWVGVSPDELRSISDTWWSPEYKDLVVDGRLANVVGPWDLLGASVRLRVLESDQAPYCVDSTDSALQSVIADTWDHELVLCTLPD